MAHRTTQETLIKFGWFYTLIFVLGLSVALFFYTLPANGSVVEDYEDYSLGNWYEQSPGWTIDFGTSTLDIDNGQQYSGAYSLFGYSNLSRSYKNFSTSTSGTFCFHYYINQLQASYTQHNIFDLKQGSNLYAGFAIQDDAQIVKIRYGGTTSTTPESLDLQTWEQLCIIYDGTDITFKINGNTYAGYTTFYSSWDQVNIDIAHLGGYMDFLVDSESEDPLTYAGQLEWIFPQIGYPLWELSNDEWNDWELYVDLTEGDVGNFNLIAISCNDVYGINSTEWDFLASTTTDPFLHITNRTSEFPDGEVYCLADLIKISGCEEWDDDDCIWDSIATEYVQWYASTTGWSKLDPDFPYGMLATFTPATSTGEEEDWAENIKVIWGYAGRIFPFSIAFQLKTLSNDLRHEGDTVNPISAPLNTILPAEMALALTDDAVLFSSDSFLTVFPWWTTTVYPVLTYLIYLMWALAAIKILWPRSKK